MEQIVRPTHIGRGFQSSRRQRDQQDWIFSGDLALPGKVCGGGKGKEEAAAGGVVFDSQRPCMHVSDCSQITTLVFVLLYIFYVINILVKLAM